jgi:hypothetical protein
MRKSMSARLAILAGAAATLALGGGAFAYFTTSGSGTATATVGGGLSALTVTGSVSGELYPAGSPTTVKITIKNTGAHAAHVQTTSLTSITADAGHSSCDTSTTGGTPAFTMAPVAIGKTLAAGEETTATGSLQMNDTGVPQDACQGASLTLHFASS